MTDPKAKKSVYSRVTTWLIVAGVLLFIVGTILSGCSSGKSSTSAGTSGSTSNTGGATTTTAATTTAPPSRTVKGTATTLGAGTFPVGTDPAPGLYDVTPGPGESGNFMVSGTNSYNEILGNAGAAGGVPMARVELANGDSIQISSLSQVAFAPVTTPYVTTHTPVTLYAGTWTVGQDVGPGRYVATPGAGQSGNIMIDNEGVNEILGNAGAAGGVPNVTFTVKNGDVIAISSLAQVMLTPS